MGNSEFGDPVSADDYAKCFEEIPNTKEAYCKTDSTWTTMRCNRVYGCIECRNTMNYMGASNNQELFQCQNKKCSMHMKVLMIEPALIGARIIAP